MGQAALPVFGGVHFGVPVHGDRQCGERQRQVFPIAVDGHVNDILFLLRAAAGEHDAHIVVIVLIAVAPRLYAMEADVRETAGGGCKAASDDRMAAAQGDHMAAEIVHIPVAL